MLFVSQHVFVLKKMLVCYDKLVTLEIGEFTNQIGDSPISLEIGQFSK